MSSANLLSFAAELSGGIDLYLNLVAALLRHEFRELQSALTERCVIRGKMAELELAGSYVGRRSCTEVECQHTSGGD